MLKICVDELKTSKYKAFINYAFSTCDFLSFIVDYENQPQDDFLEKLEKKNFRASGNRNTF